MRITPVRSRSTRSASWRRLGALTSLAIVAALATGCSDGDDGDADDPETVTVTETADGGTAGALSDEQLEQVVLTPENLGEGWTERSTDEEDDSDEGPGCLADIDEVTESVEEAGEVDKSFVYGDAGVPQVESGASTFDDEGAITNAFDEVQAALTNCTSATGTDDGTTYDLTLTTDDTAAEGVDDQVNLVANGTISDASGNNIEISLHLTMARVGSTVVTIGTTDFSDISAAHETYAQIGIDRLIAVVAGEEPAATTAPAPA